MEFFLEICGSNARIKQASELWSIARGYRQLHERSGRA